MSEVFQELHEELSCHLDAIKEHFIAGARVTLVVRFPDSRKDNSCVLSDDDLEGAIMAIRDLQARCPGAIPGSACIAPPRQVH
jgi:hypothetical protein